MGRIVPAPLSGRLVISTTNRWLMPPANFLWATQILGKAISGLFPKIVRRPCRGDRFSVSVSTRWLRSAPPPANFRPPLRGLSSLPLGTLITRSGDSHHPSGDSHPSLWGLSSPPPGTLITPSEDSHHPLWGLSSSSPGGRREISRWREPPVPDENHNAARQGRRTEKSRRRRTNVQVAMRQCCRRHPLAVLTASLVSRLSSALSPRGRPRLSQRRQGWLPSPGRSQPALPGSGKPDAP